MTCVQRSSASRLLRHCAALRCRVAPSRPHHAAVPRCRAAALPLVRRICEEMGEVLEVNNYDRFTTLDVRAPACVHTYVGAGLAEWLDVLPVEALPLRLLLAGGGFGAALVTPLSLPRPPPPAPCTGRGGPAARRLLGGAAGRLRGRLQPQGHLRHQAAD